MNQHLPDGTVLTEDLLAVRLRQLRKQAGLSQKALAERLGISGPAIAQWETGRHRPDTRWLPKLASLLNCQPSDLRPDLFQPMSALELRRSNRDDSVVSQAVVNLSVATESITTPRDLSSSDSAQDVPMDTGLSSSTEIDWTQHADLVRLEPDFKSQTSTASRVFTPPQPAGNLTDSPTGFVAQATTASVATAEHQPSESLLLSPLQLRRARQQRRLERRELAALLHVDAFKIQQWEQGTASPNAWQSHRLAQVLGLRQGQLRSMANRVKFTVLQAPNAVRVPILPIYEQPPAQSNAQSNVGSHPAAVGHMPALHAQATLVFRLPVGRWDSPVSASWLHVQVSPCQARDVPDHAKSVRRIEHGLCLRQRMCLEGQTIWFAPASQFGTAVTTPLQPDEWVWRVWAVVAFSDDDADSRATQSASEWHAYT